VAFYYTSELYVLRRCGICYQIHLAFSCIQDGIQGEAIGAIAPTKTYESNFIHQDFFTIRMTAFAV